MKRFFIIAASMMLSISLFSQQGNTSNAAVRALEIESLVPMFFYGGFQAGIGYRHNNFRIRLTVINGGSFDLESGLFSSAGEFKRFYNTSPAVIVGYNVWRDLELYAFSKFHSFAIEQTSTGMRQNMRTYDFGLGIGYLLCI